MLFYFGLAFLIDDTIRERADHLTAREEELSFTEGLVAAVSYVGLSGWLWLRWRNHSAVHEDTRPGDNCDGDYSHNRWCYVGRRPRPSFGFALSQQGEFRK
jgi:hypothetical protein